MTHNEYVVAKKVFSYIAEKDNKSIELNEANFFLEYSKKSISNKKPLLKKSRFNKYGKKS